MNELLTCSWRCIDSDMSAHPSQSPSSAVASISFDVRGREGRVGGRSRTLLWISPVRSSQPVAPITIHSVCQWYSLVPNHKAVTVRSHPMIGCWLLRASNEPAAEQNRARKHAHTVRFVTVHHSLTLQAAEAAAPSTPAPIPDIEIPDADPGLGSPTRGMNERRLSTRPLSARISRRTSSSSGESAALPMPIPNPIPGARKACGCGCA